MHGKNKNVQKPDNIILSLKKLFPAIKFKVRQKNTSISARGLGIKFELSSTETNLEPTED